MSIELLILVFSTLVSLVVGLFVLARNPRSIISQVYAVLSLCLLVYPIFNHLSLQTSDRLAYIRLVVFFASLSVYFQYFLVSLLAGRADKKLQRVLMTATLAVAVFNLSPLVFNGLTDGDNPVPTPGILAPLFLAHFIVLISLTTRRLIVGVRKFSGQRRAQFQLLIIGMIPIFVFSPLTSFVMPVVFKNSSLIFLSPIYGAFFVCMVGYAIVKHKLFDIRLIVARTIAYLLSLVGIAAMYGAFVMVASHTFFEDQSISVARQVFYVAMSVIAGLTAIPIKHFFDRWTNRLFYRDAYDAQAFLDRLNKELVSNINLSTLLNKSASIIEENLKSEFCIFELKKTDYSPQRAIGTMSKEFRQRDIDLKQSSDSHDQQMIIVTEDLDENNPLKSILRKHDIAIMARLATDLSHSEKELGYIVFGPKKSGNPYNKQDLRIIEIIANELVIAILNALRFEEIEQFNITLKQKVDDATRRLRSTNEKLKALDETKDEFISMASHQLRTPLTSVKGYISMVLEGDAGKITKQQKQLLDQAFVSSQRMVYLIADLLNVSRLKTGKFVIEPKSINLADVIESEVAQLKDTAQARNLELAYDKPANFPNLMLDDTKIRQVIMNFIDNAIYYTPAEGHIKVTLKETPSVVEFTVVDDGIGVPKREQHQLFSKFYRAGNARKARPDGTGLGLFMAKKVIIAQGGSTIFKSTEGKGSTFGFTFPKARLLAPAADAKQSGTKKAAK